MFTNTLHEWISELTCRNAGMFAGRNFAIEPHKNCELMNLQFVIFNFVIDSPTQNGDEPS